MNYEDIQKRIKELDEKECLTKEDRQEMAELQQAGFEFVLSYN